MSRMNNSFNFNKITNFIFFVFYYEVLHLNANFVLKKKVLGI